MLRMRRWRVLDGRDERRLLPGLHLSPLNPSRMRKLLRFLPLRELEG